MTDDERFSLLVGLTGASDLWPVAMNASHRACRCVPGMCRGFPGSGSRPC